MRAKGGAPSRGWSAAASSYSPVRRELQTAAHKHPTRLHRNGPSRDEDSNDNGDDVPRPSRRATINNNNFELRNSPYIDDDIDHFARTSRRISQERQFEEEAPQQEEDEAESQDAHEVYLCTCCGVTKEVHPAMRHMPLLRSLFFLFNFLVFAFGLALLGMGLWFRIDPKVYEIHKYIETQNFTIAGWIMLFGGFLACLIALLGFVGAVKLRTGILLLYLFVVISLTLAFVGALVLLTVYGLGSTLEMFLTKEIYEQIRRRTMNTELDVFMNSDAAQFLDFVQVKMRCCGAESFRDYQKLGMVIPTTCYTIAGNYINAPGCGRAIRELMDIRAGMAAGFAVGSVVAQLVVLILVGLMVCAVYNWRANPQPASDASAKQTWRREDYPAGQSARPPSRASSSIAV